MSLLSEVTLGYTILPAMMCDSIYETASTRGGVNQALVSRNFIEVSHIGVQYPHG